MHRNQSVSAHSFAMVPRADIPRSRFNVQTSHKTTFDAGKLIPIYVEYRDWDNWKRFMGEQRNPGDSTSFLVSQSRYILLLVGLLVLLVTILVCLPSGRFLPVRVLRIRRCRFVHII